jgi:PAS domain S-box-containing protein
VYIKYESLFPVRIAVEEPDNSLDKILHGAVDIISSSWQYPEDTCARIIFEGKEFKTSNFKETKWIQSSDIIISDGKRGVVEVYYLEKKPEAAEGPFLKEERHLIDALARQLVIIVERKKAEELLQGKEARITSILASSPNAITVTDLNGNVIECNQATLKMHGYSSKDEILGENALMFTSKKNHKRVVENLKNTLEQGLIKNIEYTFVTKDGREFPAELSASVIKDSFDNPIGFVAITNDITERKKNEEELEKHRYHLEELVEECSVELTKTNERLQLEIMERKKAEGDAIQTKEYLQNVINSASENIISFDNNNRVTTWNKTAELLTGFKQREVIGRHVTKLSVFDNPQALLDNLKSISYGKKHGFDELVLRTKDNAKRIIRVSCSAIESNKDRRIGVLFVGKDITHNVESHGKLLMGNSYFISDKSNRSALEFFVSLTKSGYKGLFITRATPEIIKSTICSKDIQIVLLKQNKSEGFENIQDLDGLTAKIKEFSRKNTDSVILLDGVHYLLTRFSFEQFAKSLFQINDITSENKSILLFHLDPSLVDKRQMAIIENELQLLPSQKIDVIEIEEELYDILKFIYEQEHMHSLATYKKISKGLSIVNQTTAKRLRLLENKGLVYIKKRGKTKTVHISEKGKTLLHKRQII